MAVRVNEYDPKARDNPVTMPLLLSLKPGGKLPAVSA